MKLILLWQETTGVDTTSMGYQIGYEIGSWLPFLVLAVLLVAVIIRSTRRARSESDFLDENN